MSEPTTNTSKHTTVEQLKMLAQRTKVEIGKVDTKVTALSTRVDELVTVGGEPNKIEAIKVNGAALDIADKTVDIGATIASAVAAADHLQRKKVDSKDAIDPAAEGADKFIYMVPKTGSDADDLYDEYMVLDGKVEHVGNTKIDLSDYVQKSDIANDTEVSAMLDEIFGASTEPDPAPDAPSGS